MMLFTVGFMAMVVVILWDAGSLRLLALMEKKVSIGQEHHHASYQSHDQRSKQTRCVVSLTVRQQQSGTPYI